MTECTYYGPDADSLLEPSWNPGGRGPRGSHQNLQKARRGGNSRGQRCPGFPEAGAGVALQGSRGLRQGVRWGRVGMDLEGWSAQISQNLPEPGPQAQALASSCQGSLSNVSQDKVKARANGERKVHRTARTLGSGTRGDGRRAALSPVPWPGCLNSGSICFFFFCSHGV